MEARLVYIHKHGYSKRILNDTKIVSTQVQIDVIKTISGYPLVTVSLYSI